MVQVMLEFSQDTINVLPGRLVVHSGRLVDKMSGRAKVKGIGLMKTVTSNAPRVPTTTRFVVTFEGLGSVTPLPTRLRVVEGKWEQSQPEGDQQREQPTGRCNDGNALVPKECKEEWREVKQQAKMKERDVRTNQLPNIAEAKVVNIDMPRGWVADVPSSLAFHKAKIGFRGCNGTGTTSMSGSVVSCCPPTTLSTPVESLSSHCFGLWSASNGSNLFPVWRASVTTILFGFRALPGPMTGLVAVVADPRLGPATCLFDQGKDFRLSSLPLSRF